jgi:PAS domain S-box-containing protein
VKRRGALLLVDDNELSRDPLARRLQQRGYDVILASSGREALALAERPGFDLVLLDVEMPGISGLEVLETLRATRSQTDLPIIMVTGRAAGADIVQAFQMGANDYVTKPVDFPVALARIDTHLSLKRAIESLRDSEERYALAALGANDGLWDWNLQTNTVYWSARWKRMLGHADGEVGSSPDEWFNRVHADDLPAVRKTLAAHLAGSGGHYESEHRIRHKDGTFRWVLCRGAAIRNEAGTATRLAGSLTDITDRRRSI